MKSYQSRSTWRQFVHGSRAAATTLSSIEKKVVAVAAAENLEHAGQAPHLPVKVRHLLGEALRHSSRHPGQFFCSDKEAPFEAEAGTDHLRLGTIAGLGCTVLYIPRPART